MDLLFVKLFISLEKEIRSNLKKIWVRVHDFSIGNVSKFFGIIDALLDNNHANSTEQ